MKKIIIAVFLFVSVIAFSQNKEYTFQAGDTTMIFGFNEAKSVWINVIDSSITGTDSIGVYLRVAYSNSVTGYSTISVHLLATTTQSTFIASSLLIPGASTTGTWVFYPGGSAGSSATLTGTLYVARLNVNDHVTPYAPKTRIILHAE